MSEWFRQATFYLAELFRQIAFLYLLDPNTRSNFFDNFEEIGNQFEKITLQTQLNPIWPQWLKFQLGGLDSLSLTPPYLLVDFNILD